MEVVGEMYHSLKHINLERNRDMDMEIFVISCIVTLIFWLGYQFFILRSLKSVVVYLVMCEILLGVGQYKLYYMDGRFFVSSVVCQIVFLVFLIISFHDRREKRELYEIFWESPFTIVMASGLRNLQKSEYIGLLKIMKDFLFGLNEFKKYNFIFISYTGQSVIFRYIFTNKEDFEMYRNTIFLEKNNAKIEEIGKGICMTYSVLTDL